MLIDKALSSDYNQMATGLRLTGYIVKRNALSSNRKVAGSRLTGSTQACLS